MEYLIAYTSNFTNTTKEDEYIKQNIQDIDFYINIKTKTIKLPNKQKIRLPQNNEQEIWSYISENIQNITNTTIILKQKETDTILNIIKIGNNKFNTDLKTVPKNTSTKISDNIDLNSIKKYITNYFPLQNILNDYLTDNKLLNINSDTNTITPATFSNKYSKGVVLYGENYLELKKQVPLNKNSSINLLIHLEKTKQVQTIIKTDNFTLIATGIYSYKKIPPYSIAITDNSNQNICYFNFDGHFNELSILTLVFVLGKPYFYLNSLPVKCNKLGNIKLTNSSIISFGGSNNNQNNMFGEIVDITIFSNALSENEISLLFNIFNWTYCKKHSDNKNTREFPFKENLIERLFFVDNNIFNKNNKLIKYIGNLDFTKDKQGHTYISSHYSTKGNGGYINLPYLNETVTGKTELSIYTEFSINKINERGNHIVSFFSSGERVLRISVNKDLTISCNITKNKTNKTINSKQKINLNQRVTVFLNITPTVVELYVNGKLDGTENLGGSFIDIKQDYNLLCYHRFDEFITSDASLFEFSLYNISFSRKNIVFIHNYFEKQKKCPEVINFDTKIKESDFTISTIEPKNKLLTIDELYKQKDKIEKVRLWIEDKPIIETDIFTQRDIKDNSELQIIKKVKFLQPELFMLENKIRLAAHYKCKVTFRAYIGKDDSSTLNRKQDRGLIIELINTHYCSAEGKDWDPFIKIGFRDGDFTMWRFKCSNCNASNTNGNDPDNLKEIITFYKNSLKNAKYEILKLKD